MKCRKVGAKNWGKSTTKEELELYEGKESLEAKIRKVLIEEGGAAGMDALVKGAGAEQKEIKDAIKGMSDVGLHKNGDYILQDGEEIDVKKKISEKKIVEGQRLLTANEHPVTKWASPKRQAANHKVSRTVTEVRKRNERSKERHRQKAQRLWPEALY